MRGYDDDVGKGILDIDIDIDIYLRIYIYIRYIGEKVMYICTMVRARGPEELLISVPTGQG